ncbi:hypothetical protein FKP32DRAFT_1083055 [Trametes sanguinea]|nr:hypothetical protein FKP32DRAFT_1083055 [Trametes sanguinea]
MLTVARVASLALVALSFFTLAHASPASRRAATNAERLARGLTPARPRRLYNPSRTNVARSAPSGSPGTVQTGQIGIYPAAGSATTPQRKRDDSLGWLSAYGITTDTSLAWQYQYTEPASTDTVVELNHPGTPYRLSGVAIRSGSQVTLGPGNAYYLELQNTRAHTPAGSASSTYVYDTYAIGYAQTTIFAVDVNGKLSVHWVNPDGSVPQTYIVAEGNNLYVTGDLNALGSQLGIAPSALTVVDIWFDVTDNSSQ